MSDLTKFITSNDKQDFTNKKILVVGTQGIGSGVATALVKRGASVIIASRNEDFGEQMVTKLRSLSPSKQEIVFKKVDLSDLQDIKRFAKDLSSEKLDHIVWSAGIFPHGPRKETKDGIERIFAVNYLSRFVGFNLLYPTLKPGARILSIYAPYMPSFHSRFKEQFDIDDVQFKKEGRYEKLVDPVNIIPSISNDLFTKKFADKHKDIVIVHQQPGFVKTELFKNSEVPAETVTNVFGDVSKFQGRTPEEYGEVAAYVLTAPEIVGYSGYGIDSEGNKYEDNEYITDPNNIDKLWEYSANLTGVGK